MHGDPLPLPKWEQPCNFRPMSIVAKRLSISAITCSLICQEKSIRIYTLKAICINMSNISNGHIWHNYTRNIKTVTDEPNFITRLLFEEQELTIVLFIHWLFVLCPALYKLCFVNCLLTKTMMMMMMKWEPVRQRERERESETHHGWPVTVKAGRCLQLDVHVDWTTRHLRSPVLSRPSTVLRLCLNSLSRCW